jgi:hypothetical protein
MSGRDQKDEQRNKILRFAQNDISTFSDGAKDLRNNKVNKYIVA